MTRARRSDPGAAAAQAAPPGPGAAGAGPIDRLLTRRQVADLLQVSATHVSHFVLTESLPAIVISGCGGSRRTLRFRRVEVEEWLARRRERQLRALLDGKRYTRRRLVPVGGGAA